jgi:hypothetical protein
MTFGGGCALIVAGGLGLMLLLLPVRTLLELDRQGRGAGYQLFRRAPDEATGRRRAGFFYRILGALLLIIAWALW